METGSQRKRVMLIDDDAITNLINTKIIKMNFDFSVNAYINAQVALEQFRQWLEKGSEQLPDIIFLDINMPIMDGWEFLDEFQKFPKSLLQRCKVFMLTSSIDLEDIEKAKNYPAVHEFISKPLTADKLRMLATAP
jgi:CheY-like chemotaxis protein